MGFIFQGRSAGVSVPRSWLVCAQVLLCRAAHYSQEARDSWGKGAFELAPADLAQYIATGRLGNDAVAELAAQVGAAQESQSGTEHEHGNGTGDSLPTVPPLEKQYEQMIDDLRNYSERLSLAVTRANDQYDIVTATEANLTASYLPTKRMLEDMIKYAVDEAARAEAEVLLERLNRVHFSQTGILERSARYWEQEFAREKELTRVAEAKTRLENEAKTIVELQADINNRTMHEVRDTEKAKMDEWLQGVNQQLWMEQREANDGILAERAYLRKKQMLANDAIAKPDAGAGAEGTTAETPAAGQDAVMNTTSGDADSKAARGANAPSFRPGGASDLAMIKAAVQKASAR